MLITRKPRSAHWYLPDGTAFYEVPNASKPGLMRPTTIRDAFKAGAYRSVTSVLDIVAKPGLVDWKIEQAILSALTLPRIEGETVETFAMRALEDSEEQSAKAREMGTRLHDLAEQYMTNGLLPFEGSVEEPLFRPFITWAEANIKRVIASEKIVVNHWHQYAGRLDLAVELNDGRLAVIDLKSQDVKLDKKGNPKPEFYDEWPLQLAAYAACHIYDSNGQPVPVDNWSLISLVIDRTRPGVYPKDWKTEHLLSSNTDFFEVFMSLCDLWSYYKGGTPGKDKEAA